MFAVTLGPPVGPSLRLGPLSCWDFRRAVDFQWDHPCPSRYNPNPFDTRQCPPGKAFLFAALPATACAAPGGSWLTSVDDLAKARLWMGLAYTNAAVGLT